MFCHRNGEHLDYLHHLQPLDSPETLHWDHLAKIEPHSWRAGPWQNCFSPRGVNQVAFWLTRWTRWVEVPAITSSLLYLRVMTADSFTKPAKQIGKKPESLSLLKWSTVLLLLFNLQSVWHLGPNHSTSDRFPPFEAPCLMAIYACEMQESLKLGMALQKDFWLISCHSCWSSKNVVFIDFSCDEHRDGTGEGFKLNWQLWFRNTCNPCTCSSLDTSI